VADAVAAWRIPEEAIAAPPNLKWIHRGAAGVEDLITPTLHESDIILTNSSGVHATNIAEHVLAMMLSFARGFPSLFRMQQDRVWDGSRLNTQVFELTGQTVLLAGVGEIGQAVANRAKALGMSTIGVRRRSDQGRPDSIDAMVGIERLNEVLGSADHVVNSLPFTEGTRSLFDASAFEMMTAGAHFYNVGRGRTVDTDALVNAVRTGKIAGAGLDVTDPEPQPSESPLWDLPNVILTAHTAGRTPHMWERVFRLIETNLERYQNGHELINVVDVQHGY
jgi:phosphoglycerate dehydrogenase-like enzyme